MTNMVNKPNTLFNYMYRDGNNYKVHNEVVISGAITPEQIEAIFDSTPDGEFIPSDVGLPETRFDSYDSSDTPWFELYSPEDTFTLTNDHPTVNMTVDELVSHFASMRDEWAKQW